MVTQALIDLFTGFAVTLIEIIPAVFFQMPEWSKDFFSLVAVGISFLPDGVFSFIMKNILFWLGIQFAWSFAEWIFKRLHM